jgi:hypothetical protein
LGWFVQLIRCHYLVIMWLLQAFLECHQPHHKHSSMGCQKEVPLCWHSKSSLWHVIFSNFLSVFVLGCRPIREVNNFFSVDSNVFSMNCIRCHWKNRKFSWL